MPFPRYGSGAVKSLSGAGVTATTGILNQSGGMNIEDSEGDGFIAVSTGGVQVTASASAAGLEADDGIVIQNNTRNALSITNYGSGALTLSGNGGGGGIGIGVGGDKVGLYGETAVAQPAPISQVVTTTPALASYGFTLPQAEALIAAVNSILDAIGAAAGGVGITA